MLIETAFKLLTMLLDWQPSPGSRSTSRQRLRRATCVLEQLHSFRCGQISYLGMLAVSPKVALDRPQRP